MKIQVDIGHPAHIHYFKNFIRIMERKGHEIEVISRDKEITFQLLDSYKIKYIKRGKGSNNLIGKLLYAFKGNYIHIKHARKFKPDIFLSFMSPYASQVSKLFGKPHIAFDDTEHSNFGKFMYESFTDVILTPKCFQFEIGKKQIRFDGYMELCYLHPNYYSQKNDVLKELGLQQDEKYVVMRFVAWNANHDVGHPGFSIKNKIKAVNEFSKFAKVFISSETDLPFELIKYQIKISPEKMHDVLANASLLYGESATMASECAVLGVPSVFLNDNRLGYLIDEEKKYGLVFNFSESEKDQQKSIECGIEILKKNNVKEEYGLKKSKLLNEKIDVTSFMVWFVENYPESTKTMKDNPDYQYNFR